MPFAFGAWGREGGWGEVVWWYTLYRQLLCTQLPPAGGTRVQNGLCASSVACWVSHDKLKSAGLVLLQFCLSEGWEWQNIFFVSDYAVHWCVHQDQVSVCCTNLQIGDSDFWNIWPELQWVCSGRHHSIRWWGKVNPLGEADTRREASLYSTDS